MAQRLSLKIGHSGVRGIVGETLTPQLVTSFAAAFGTYCGAGPILIGTDTRPSGDMLKQAAIAGLLSVGCTPIDAGVAPLPSLMLHVGEAGAFGGISVGGGPGSPAWNALRFISAEGRALRANQAAELTDLYHQGVYPRVGALEMSDLRADASSAARHLAAVTGAVDADRIRSRRFTVALAEGGGGAEGPARRMLEALGCDVVSLDPPVRDAATEEAGTEEASVARLADLVRRSGADAGFAIDGDAVRLAAVDERGTPLGRDASVALVVGRWLERKAGPVVVSVATSRMVDDAAARFGVAVHRSPVGEPNVVAAMQERGAELGGEGDGGVVVLPINACRDSFAAMAVILESAAVSGATLSGLRERLPRYAILRDRLLCPARDIAPSLRLVRNLYRGERIDLIDGVQVRWPDRWLLVRPSTTEPVLRITAEAPSATEARALVDSVLDLLSPGV